MKIPGAASSALLVALPLLAVWLGDSFPGTVWVAPVAGLLLIAVKVIEVLRSAPSSTTESFSMEAKPEPSMTQRILWG